MSMFLKCLFHRRPIPPPSRTAVEIKRDLAALKLKTEKIMAALPDVLATIATLSANCDTLIAQKTAPPSTESADLDQINTAVAAVNTKVVAAITPPTS